MNLRARQVAAILLLVLGVQFWLIIGRGEYGSSPSPLWYVPLVAVTVTVAVIPGFSRTIAAALERLRHPTPRTRQSIAIGIGLFAIAYLIFSAFHQHRDLIPQIHDEYMHLLQARMLAHGKLWMHQHPVADSFESSHIFVKPVYAAMYFPGASLALVPGIWLGLPFWVMPVILCGSAVGLLYRVVAELLDGLAGILAAILLLSLTKYRYVALTALSHGMMVFWGMLLLWAWLRWRKSPSTRWALAIGAIAGWAAITRPIDAACYALPVGIAMLGHMRGWTLRRTTLHLGAIVLAAIPFLALQGTMNRGITGSFWETPDRLYNELYTPGVSYGFHAFNPNAKLATTLPQRLKYYREFTVPAAKAHQPVKLWSNWVHERFPTLVQFALPSPWLLILIPVGLLALTAMRAVLAGMVALFIAAYMMFAYLLAHYVVVPAPGIILLVLLGVRALEETWPRAKIPVVTFSTIWIVVLALRATPEFNRLVQDDIYQTPTLQFNAKLESMIHGRALVLYHFNLFNNPQEEPVYNIHSAWPDNARIVRAQDRSPGTNEKLFDYYARIQPDRKVYWVDRLDLTGKAYSDKTLKYLGTVSQLAASYNLTTAQKEKP
jgi:hypothetical protein